MVSVSCLEIVFCKSDVRFSGAIVLTCDSGLALASVEISCLFLFFLFFFFPPMCLIDLEASSHNSNNKMVTESSKMHSMF